jgi:hypothetical protein
LATVWGAGAAAFEAEAAGADEAGVEEGAEDAVGVVGAAAFVTVWATGAAAVLTGAAGAGDAGAEEVGAAGAEAAGAEAAGVAGALATVWVTGAVAVETAWPSPEAALALPSPTSRIVNSSKAKTASSPAVLVVLLDTPAKPIRSPLPPARIDQTHLDLKIGRSENPAQAHETPSVAIYTVAFGGQNKTPLSSWPSLSDRQRATRRSGRAGARRRC